MSDSGWPHRRQLTRLPCPWDSPGKNTGVGCHFLLQCRKVKVKSLSRVRPSATLWTAAFQAPPSMGFSTQEYWSGVALPSSILLTSNSGFYLQKLETDNCGSVWSGLHLSIWSGVILAFPNCASQTCSLSHFLKPTRLVPPVWGSFYMLFPVLRMFFCPSLRVGRSFLVSFEVIPLMRLSLVI